jgi:hypothetical protein
MPSNQIFISYKSENANDVRFFVERLMAAGATVWFAEYEVLAANYDLLRSHLFRFEGEIDSQKVCLDLNINPSCVGSRSVNSRIHGPRDDDARRRHQDPRRGDGVAGALARAAAHEPVAGHAVARAQAARREPVCLLPAGGWHRALV